MLHSMAVPSFAGIQTLEEMVVIVTAAVFLKQPISAVYHGHRRSLCPHVLGKGRHGTLHVLCYQYAGGSKSGLKPHGSPENWRCISVPKLRAVSLLDEPWHTADGHSRPQTCIEEVLFDTEKLPVRGKVLGR